MAGTIVGSIDHRLGDGIISGANRNQEQFKVIYDFFAVTMVGAGHCALVASNYGSGGTGTQFWDQANPFGENAWAVFSFPNSVPTPFYVLIQWADTAAFGASPGNPGLLNGSSGDGVGIMAALREDGGSPWGGTTGSPGSDTKGTPVWVPGGSTLHVLGRSNSPGTPAGNHVTNKENTFFLKDFFNAVFARVHMFGDADGALILVDDNDDGTYDGYYVGRYTARSGLTLPHPYVLVTQNITSTWDTNLIGTLAGNAAREGGVLVNAADGVRELSVSSLSPWNSTTYQPNNLASPAEFDATKFAVFHREVTQGLAGFLPEALVASVYGSSNHETNAANTRTYLGTTTVASDKWSVPWDGGSPPGTNNTRVGRQF